MGKLSDIERWRSEILLAEDFRKHEFGEYTKNEILLAGQNIDYYERGFSFGRGAPSHSNYSDGDSASMVTTLNMIHALVKNVVPSLYYKNPRVLVFPKRKVDEEASHFASEIMNYYYKSIDADKQNRRIILDSYLLGMGVYKVGYATKFGADIPDKKQKDKSKKDRVLEAVGLKKKEENPPVRPEVNKEILAESPYVQWISPFNFLIDPRARSLDDAMWVAHVVEKTVDDLKKNPKFKNTSLLSGTDPDRPTDSQIPIPMSHIDSFRTVKLYEIHYRKDDQFYLLYIVKDGDEFKALYHEESVYDMDEWQFGILDFAGHDHLLYKRGEITKVKTLQDRLTTTVDSILEQLDSFVPKIGVDETALSSASKTVLEDGEIGSVIYFNKSPREAIQEISLTQFKADLKALLDEFINMMTIQTGVTKSQLLGISTDATATEATIAQGGSTLRLQDMTSEINKFANKQAEKLWKIIRQFVDLPTLELVTGEQGVDQETGLVKYNWLPDITEDVDDRLQNGMFRFDTEVGSTQKADTALILKRIEDLLNILARTDVIALMQQQGKKIDLAEILRMMMRQMPEVFKDTGKIIQDITQNTQGILQPDQIAAQLGVQGPGGQTSGSTDNALAAQYGQVPQQQQLQSEAAQR